MYSPATYVQTHISILNHLNHNTPHIMYTPNIRQHIKQQDHIILYICLDTRQHLKPQTKHHASAC